MGTVGASLAGPETDVDDMECVVTVTVEVTVMVTSRVIVMVASGVDAGATGVVAGASPPLG